MKVGRRCDITRNLEGSFDAVETPTQCFLEIRQAVKKAKPRIILRFFEIHLGTNLAFVTRFPVNLWQVAADVCDVSVDDHRHVAIDRCTGFR